jgi:hypothetical protein
MNALRAAIERYMEAKIVIPSAWIKELADLQSVYEEVN